MRKVVLAAGLSVLLAALMCPTAEALIVVTGPTAAPENSISDVMVKAHKDGLLTKVLKGEASDDEKKMLLGLYIDMIENEPPQGEMNDWIMQAGPAVLAAGKVVVGREGATDELKAATNCKACHDKFKGE